MTDAIRQSASAKDIALEDAIFDVALLDQPTLQRGGEELALEKVDDRFTLCPTAGHSFAEVLTGLGDVVATPILSNLIEIQVAPDRLEPLMQSVRASQAVAFASHVYQMCQSPGTLLYPTDQITIQFGEQVTSDQMHSIAAAAGLRILKLIAGVPKAFVFQMTASTVTNPLKLAIQLIQYSEVVLAEPNVAVLRQPYYRPRESDYAQQWYLNHEGGEDLVAGSHIFAEPAWNLTRGKRSVAVAIVDDGIDFNHPDFQSEGKIVAPFTLPQSNLSLSSTSSTNRLLPNFESHGTASARIIAADETGRGMIGVAPGCSLMPIQIGSFIDDQTIEQVCQWAVEKGADVIYCGWGAAAVYFPLSLRQRIALTQAATQGRDGRGCVIVFGAGNANRPIDGIVQEQGWANRLLQGETHWLNGFAVHPDVITVAACTSLNQKSACSNWGSGIAVVAPAGQSAPVLSTQQTGLLPVAPTRPTPQAGKRIRFSKSAQRPNTNPTGAAKNPDTGDADPGELPLGDTSAAAAIVAGVAALILSINPDLTAEEVRQILEQTADKIVDREADVQLGLHLGDYGADRYSAWFGHGKVNAVKAVQLAQRQILPLPLPYRWIQYANRESIKIPDGDLQGITSSIQVTDSSLIRDIEVSVELKHSFMGDLELYLISPWGSVIPLQSRALGRLTALKTTYSLENTLWLKTALNRPAIGQWQLQLIDWIPENTGELQSWQLSLGV